MSKMSVGVPVVLVVDDEPLVRMLAVDLLEDAGFAVVEAGDSAEALQVLSTRSDVSVPFTDIDMPGRLDGLELAHRVQACHPAIAIVVASGKATPAPHELAPGLRFFPKPSRGEAIVVHLRGSAAAS